MLVCRPSEPKVAATMAERRFHAPGRVNLIGEHTDYTGGLVLPTAIDRGVTLVGEPGGGRIQLTSGSEPGEVDLAADGSEVPARGWGRYVAAVAAELHELGREPLGFRGHLTSDLPTGSGLSSSAALEVVLGTALCVTAGFEIEPLALAGAMQRAERRGVGVPCGIMDQAASILGRADHAVLLDCGSLAYRSVPLPPSLALVIIDSGVRRQLGESGYAQRRAELERALVAIGDRRPQDVDPAEVDDLADAADLDDVARRRLRHVVTENARVEAVEAALTRPDGPDLAALGVHFSAGHASLRDDFEVSTPELDRLVALSLDAGAAAARMTGGGFGGAIIALAEHDLVPELGEAVTSIYRREQPDLEPTVLVAAEGARELR